MPSFAPPLDGQSSTPDLVSSYAGLDFERSPPIPTTGIILKLRQIDEIDKLKGILKPSSSNRGSKIKVDSEG